MTSEQKNYIFTAENENELMRWIIVLSFHIGDKPREEEIDPTKYKLEVPEESNSTQLALQFLPRDRNALSDVLNTTEEVNVYPNIISVIYSDNRYVTVTFSILDTQDNAFSIKAARFDRNIGDRALLYVVDLVKPYSRDEYVRIFVLLRCVSQNENGDMGYTPNVSFTVHDLECQDCLLTRQCDDPKRGAIVGKNCVEANVRFPKINRAPSAMFHAMALNNLEKGTISYPFVFRELDTEELAEEQVKNLLLSSPIFQNHLISLLDGTK
jgi:hypothetical protein